MSLLKRHTIYKYKKNIKNIRILRLLTGMYRNLNDLRKHITVYPKRAWYLDKSYRLCRLLKVRTPSHETHSFGIPFQTDTERL